MREKPNNKCAGIFKLERHCYVSCTRIRSKVKTIFSILLKTSFDSFFNSKMKILKAFLGDKKWDIFEFLIAVKSPKFDFRIF